MIDALSQTLRTILTRPGLPAPLSSAQIVFDRPSDPFSPTQTTVDMFLYDVRENLDLRSNELTITRHGPNHTATIEKAPLRLACSYLVTAWPVGGVDLALQEQLLLAEVLHELARFPTIPSVFLQGALVGQDPPLPMVTLSPDALKNLSEFWASVGNKLKPSLTVTVTISMPVFDTTTDFLVTTSTTSTSPAGGPLPDASIQIGGRIVDQAAHAVPNALVDIVDAGLGTTTDADGRYTFTRVPTGAHTIRVVAAGFQPLSQAVTVPGRPGDYDLTLTPL